MSDLGDIPGLVDDLSNQKENTARTFAFKAFRCYHLAESYVVAKKWVESMCLMDRTLEHVTQTLEQYRELKLGTEGMHRIDKVSEGGGMEQYRELKLGTEGMHRIDKVREGGGVRMCLMD